MHKSACHFAYRGLAQLLFTYLKVSHCSFQQAKFQSISASEQTGLNMACSLNPNTGFGGAKKERFLLLSGFKLMSITIEMLTGSLLVASIFWVIEQDTFLAV